MNKAPISFNGRQIEPPWFRMLVLISRVIVVAAGLVLLVVAILVIKSGVVDESWGTAAAGGILVLGALAVVWAACTSKARDVCQAAALLIRSR